MTALLEAREIFARLALELAARGHVMDTGRITLAGRGADLLADPRVRATYYLGEASRGKPRPRLPADALPSRRTRAL